MNAFWQQLASATQVDRTIRPRLPGRFESPTAVDSESESPVERGDEAVPVVSRPPSTTTIEFHEVDKRDPQQPASKEVLLPSEPLATAPPFKEENEARQMPPDNLSLKQQSPFTSEKEHVQPPAEPPPEAIRPAVSPGVDSPRYEWPELEEVIRGKPAPARTITADLVPTQRPPLFEASPQEQNTENFGLGSFGLGSKEDDGEAQAVDGAPVTGELSPVKQREEFLKPLERPQPAIPAASAEKPTTDEPPVIEISIGRIVLRPEALPAPAPPRQRFQPQITLEGYLRERNGGSR